MRATRARVRLLVAENGTFLGLIVLACVFAALNEHFLTWRNAVVVLQSAAPLAVLAFPLALLVISGSVDLSVGAVASMAAVVGAAVMGASDSSVLGVGAAVAFGAAAGGFNGVLVNNLGLNPIVVTLGALTVWQGIASYATDGETLTTVTSFVGDFGTARLLGVPAAVFLAVAVALLCGFVLYRRPLGREIYAVGGNERSAFLMGIAIKRVRLGLFVATGAAAGLTGLVYVAQLQAAPPDLGAGLELSVLTIVLLGGVAFTGGVGRLSGVLAGLLFVGVLQNGLVLQGTSEFLQQVFIGAALIVAVAFDTSVARLTRSSWVDVGRRTLARETPADDIDAKGTA